MTPQEVLSVMAAHLGLHRLSLDHQGACAVAFDDAMDLDIQVLESCDELRLALPLGGPAPGTRDALLVEALVTNTLLAGKSHRHLAWEDGPERLVLCATLRLDTLAPAEVGLQLGAFLGEARTIRLQMQQAGALD